MESENKIMLVNLNELALELQKKYREEFDSNEIILSENFKEAYGSYLRNNSQNVSYTKYTATVTSSGNLKMYIPNQWFKAAAFMVPYIIELDKYKNLVENIVALHITKDKKKYYAEMKNTDDEDRIDEFENWVVDYLESNFEQTEGLDVISKYLTSFVTDYQWWSGNKTIDRGDYYVSPVLSLLGVVNTSQSYIATISHNFATNEELITVAENMVSSEDDNEEISDPTYEHESDLETDSLRKTGGINEIVYGAPGTGKSRYLADKYGQPPLTRRVVFHSEYSYYDFIGVYKPVPVYKETNDKLKSIDGKEFSSGEPYIDYRFIPGPFITVLVEAWLDPKNMHTLLIEEINRADAAAVFGEVFQLLDRDIDGSSEYRFQPSEDLYGYLMSIEGLEPYLKDGVGIPSNMNIVATMNSADQGVKPMDSAFKRRWNFHYVRIKIKGAVHEKAEIQYAGRKVYWGSLVDLINRKLSSGTIKFEEDKLIGPYFIKPDEVGKKGAIDKLLLYLWDDVLRHNRSEFFNSNISSFADLSEKFEIEDVLNLMQSAEDVEYLEVRKNNDINDSELEESEETEEIES